jgi:hypothetical protein
MELHSRHLTSLISSTVVIESIINTMSLIVRALVRALKPVSPLSFARSFSVYHAIQVEGYYARLRQQDPEALRRRLDSDALSKQRWHLEGDNLAKEREYSRLYKSARREGERQKFYQNIMNWCKRYAWLREDLPWKSYRPFWHESKVEHHCEGCNWTMKGGNRLWWLKIVSSLTTKADSWLCHGCYVPRSDCKEAMPRGYEGLTTIKEIAKRRDELGHGV